MRYFTPDSFNGRRAWWLFLLIAIAIILLTAWSRESATGPLHTVRSGVQTVAAPVASAGRWVFTPLHDFLSWTSEIGSARSEVVLLQKQNDELRARLIALQEEQVTNTQVEHLTQVLSDQGYVGVIASVISYPPNAWDQVVILDKGTNDKLDIGMPVVGANGLLGQIIEAGPRYCRVRLITDQRSGVAGLVQRTRAAGIVKGDHNAGLNLEFVSTDETLEAGDVVLTSGIGGVFPKGLIIGSVLEVSSESNELYRSARLKPVDEIHNIERVMVITNTSPQTDSLDLDE